jgi:hypothetical protein
VTAGDFIAKYVKEELLDKSIKTLFEGLSEIIEAASNSEDDP